jgi:cytochrome c553
MKATLAALVGALCLSLATAHAGNLEAGSKKSEPCAACHGAVGISPNTSWPNLAGQQADLAAFFNSLPVRDAYQ